MPNHNPNQFDQGAGGGPAPGRRPKTLLIWILLAILFGYLLYSLSQPGAGGQTKHISTFYRDFWAGRVKSIVYDGEHMKVSVRPSPGEKVDVSEYQVALPKEAFERVMGDVVDYNSRLVEEGRSDEIVELSAKVPSKVWEALITFLPWLLFGVFIWFFFLRPMRAPGGGVLSFGKSRARLLSKERTQVTFDDVAGIDEAKEDVQEIIEFLKNPDKFRRLGGRLPRGVLLVGPPGTGKTLLARAIAGEANRPFFSISGSDFVEMFVGVGASRVRDLFRQAKERSPCIVFLDEVDAVGRRRGTGLGGGHDEREQTLNAILVEMDGFETDENIIVIAATNRPDVLDPALLRPGRFDRQVVVELPDVKGREAILKVHARKRRFADDVDLSRIARGTPGFSGADLENLINEAAIIAVMKGREAITIDDLEEARDKVMWGRQKRSRVMAEDEKRAVAYHESGHAILAKLLPEVEPLHKVTIVPRGAALGATMSLPERDIYLKRKKSLLGDITVLMGGRVSEELFCNDISSGAQSDFERATELARLMVCKWGMSETIGPVNYTESEEHLFLGREITRIKTMSEETSIMIDREIKRIIDECYERAKGLLTEKRDAVQCMVDALIKFEVLDVDQVDRILAGEELPEKVLSPSAQPTGSHETRPGSDSAKNQA